MNDIILNMLERRSIRRYENKAVSKEAMAEILNAGAWAQRHEPPDLEAHRNY